MKSTTYVQEVSNLSYLAILIENVKTKPDTVPAETQSNQWMTLVSC